MMFKKLLYFVLIILFLGTIYFYFITALDVWKNIKTPLIKTLPMPIEPPFIPESTQGKG